MGYNVSAAPKGMALNFIRHVEFCRGLLACFVDNRGQIVNNCSLLASMFSNHRYSLCLLETMQEEPCSHLSRLLVFELQTFESVRVSFLSPIGKKKNKIFQNLSCLRCYKVDLNLFVIIRDGCFGGTYLGFTVSQQKDYSQSRQMKELWVDYSTFV